MSIFSYFPPQITEVRPESANDEHPRHFCMEPSWGSRSPSVPLDGQWLPSFESIGSASLSSDFDGWRVSWWEVMVSLHACTFISWEKPGELPHFIFLLLSLMLHDSKLMLKLYYLLCQFLLLLTGCDTNNNKNNNNNRIYIALIHRCSKRFTM